MSGHWIDPRPAALHLPAYPVWVQQRVEALNRAYVIGTGMLDAERVYEAYAEAGGGNGRQVLSSHMEWLAKMWLLGGPRVPAPEPHQVPAILSLLGRIQREPPLLGEWLLDLITVFARDHGWECRLLVDLEDIGFRTPRIRFYWELLMGLVGTRDSAGFGDNDAPLDMLASRVVRRLHRGCSLFEVVRGALILESKQELGLALEIVEIEASLLDDPEGLIVSGVAVRSVRHCVQEQRHAKPRSGALPEVEFRMWDPDEDVEAWLAVAHVQGVGWRVARLKRHTAPSVLPGSRLHFAAGQVCHLLDRIGGLNSHLARHMTASNAAESWRRLGESSRRLGASGRILAALNLETDEALDKLWCQAMMST